ncbi:ORF6N domain-containing protein [Gelidibacter japonicus]|nr:ORF6N domain-containing protein [Gelidibacter japonicus]MCL8008496.1 ORF6N domain-containing protein [Gelidibacter japonicus]
MKPQEIENRIYEIRHQNVMLDFDLAEMYQIETRVLKQAVRRNLERFPKDFMFELTEMEIVTMVSQNVIPSKQ